MTALQYAAAYGYLAVIGIGLIVLGWDDRTPPTPPTAVRTP